MTVRLANEATVSNAMVTATGILVDETGQPLIGASVVVKGGKERTITDKKGAFSLEVPANAILRCSYQGRESQEVLAADMTNNTHLSLSSKSREMNEQVFTVVEKMPSFPGGDAELLKYIATNIKYPKESQDNGEQGRVICSFIVGRDGSVNNPEVLRGVTPLLNEEAVRVINTMPRWNPGMQRGKAVAVKYTVPITFRLKSPVEEAKEETLTVVDVMPQYPGGDRELLKFIAQSIKYPTDAQEAGVQGRVICSFVVDKKGNIVEPKIIRGIDPSLDAEALRVIGMMPRWTPGRQDERRSASYIRCLLLSGYSEIRIEAVLVA